MRQQFRECVSAAFVLLVNVIKHLFRPPPTAESPLCGLFFGCLSKVCVFSLKNNKSFIYSHICAKIMSADLIFIYIFNPCVVLLLRQCSRVWCWRFLVFKHNQTILC